MTKNPTKPTKSFGVANAVVLAVFCAFAVSVFLVLILAAGVYQNISDSLARGQNERTALSFVRTRIKQADTADAVSVIDFHGIPALSVTEVLGGRTFVTFIYYYDGYIRELFHEAGFALPPQTGVPLIAAVPLDFTVTEQGLINVQTHYGQSYIFVRSGRGAN